MGVGEQDGVNGREVLDAHAGLAETMDEDEPIGEDGVNDEVESAELEQEGGVSYEGDAEFGRIDEDGLALGSGGRTKCRSCDELEGKAEAGTRYVGGQGQSPVIWMLKTASRFHIRAQGSGLRAQGSGLRAQGSGLRALDALVASCVACEGCVVIFGLLLEWWRFLGLRNLWFCGFRRRRACWRSGRSGRGRRLVFRKCPTRLRWRRLA